MANYFNNLKDNYFFSDKLTHLYLDGEITNTVIDKLIEDIRNANKETTPKPILIHISSVGGSLQDGMRLMSIYNISKLPIATIIDNYSFSISTLLSINSSYRLMTKNGFCLLHEYRIQGYINNERQHIFNYMEKLDTYFKIIIDMYVKKTSFTKSELTELLKHNLILNYKTCLEKGIVDRIVDCNYNKKTAKLNIINLIQDSSVHNIHLSCSSTINALDKQILEINTANKKPCLIYITHFNCDNDKDDKKEKPQTNESEEIYAKKSMINIFKPLALVSRIKSIQTNKYGIIDVPISIENIIPLLYTDKIYMYSHAFIICNLLYAFNNYSLLLNDNIKNTNLIINTIKSILKSKTKMTQTDIENINEKFVILDAKRAKELGLCHEIIHN